MIDMADRKCLARFGITVAIVILAGLMIAQCAKVSRAGELESVIACVEVETEGQEIILYAAGHEIEFNIDPALEPPAAFPDPSGDGEVICGTSLVQKPAAIDLAGCIDDECILAVWRDGTEAEVILYRSDACRLDLNGDRGVGLDDISSAFIVAGSGGSCP